MDEMRRTDQMQRAEGTSYDIKGEFIPALCGAFAVVFLDVRSRVHRCSAGKASQTGEDQPCPGDEAIRRRDERTAIAGCARIGNRQKARIQYSGVRLP